MLPRPKELSRTSPDIRRFEGQLQKEMKNQGLHNKNSQTIVLRPSAGWGGLTVWMTNLCKDQIHREYVVACVNEDLQGSGWQIKDTCIVKNDRGTLSGLAVTLKYRAAADEGLDLEIQAA
ncbi:MAG TPA: hypothetical protein EYN27_12915 [Rhodospirillales bacterium]|nr:hypothetical protein [Rhodospirillales bacterium]